MRTEGSEMRQMLMRERKERGKECIERDREQLRLNKQNFKKKLKNRKNFRPNSRIKSIKLLMIIAKWMPFPNPHKKCILKDNHSLMFKKGRIETIMIRLNAAIDLKLIFQDSPL